MIACMLVDLQSTSVSTCILSSAFCHAQANSKHYKAPLHACTAQLGHTGSLVVPWALARMPSNGQATMPAIPDMLPPDYSWKSTRPLPSVDCALPFPTLTLSSYVLSPSRGASVCTKCQVGMRADIQADGLAVGCVKCGYLNSSFAHTISLAFSPLSLLDSPFLFSLFSLLQST